MGGQAGAAGGTSCAAGLDPCSGTCTDMTSDLKNCGSCGNVCRQGQICQASACVTIVGCGVTPTTTRYFCEDFEDAFNRWTVTGLDWWTTVTISWSPTHSFTNNPTDNYVNGSLALATLTGSIDLTSAIEPQLSFWEHGSGYVQRYIDISKDAGLTWATLWGGNSNAWVDWRNTVIDLKAYAGTTIKLRFDIQPGTNTDAGWYVDDVIVREFQ